MNHSPSGRVGLSGPERVFFWAGEFGSMRRRKPSPAATASDPPASGRVMQTLSVQKLKNRTTSKNEGEKIERSDRGVTLGYDVERLRHTRAQRITVARGMRHPCGKLLV